MWCCPLFTLPSSQFQKSPPSNLERDLSTSAGDAGGFSREDTVCRGWVTSTYTNFPAVPPVSLHCPHPIKISISDIFQPPPPELPKTGVRHARCCPSLGLLHIGNGADPKHRAAVSASHSSKLNYCCNHLQEKLLRFKQQPWNKENFPRVKHQ